MVKAVKIDIPLKEIFGQVVAIGYPFTEHQIQMISRNLGHLLT